MKKLLTGLVLPLFALTALMGTANAQISPITSSSVNVSEANTLNFVLSPTENIEAGESIIVYARAQDGSTIPFTAGTIVDADDNLDVPMAMTVEADGSLSYTTGLTIPAAANFRAGIEATLQNPATAQNVSVLVFSTNGEAAGTTYAVDGADTVQVTAIVESTLSMEIITTDGGVDTDNNITFGVLPLGEIVDSIADLNQQTDITIRTNAQNGYTLNAAATSTAVDRLLDWAVAYDNLLVQESNNNAGFAIRATTAAAPGLAPLGAGTAAITANAQPLATGGATASDVTTVEYGVVIGTGTTPGTYSEAITYSVTASF